MQFIDISKEFLWEFVLLLPIGLIGLWRWSMWLVKSILSSRWRDALPSERTKDWKVGVALTVKGEPVDTFEQLLQHLVAEKIDQACIVFDYREEENMRRTQEFALNQIDQIDIRIKSTDKKGKREGLSQAIAMSEGMNIIMCMDSDTLLGEGVKESVKAAFANSKVGGVAVGQRCHQPENWVQHLFDIRLVLRYAHDIPGQALGGRITCLSGRCSAYLAEPLQKIAPGLLTEEWGGIRKTGGGDDKYLTTALHDLGYLSVVVKNAWVYTRSEKSLKVYISQSLRWARNSWFSDIRALVSRWWMRKSPILLFYTLDRMVSTFTILLGIWFLIFALWHQQFVIAIVLVIWWHISRIVKGWSYFKETNRYFMIIPYTFMSFFIGILKVHALITLYEGSWLTRGASAQKKLRKQIINNMSRLASSGVIVVVGLLVFGVLNEAPLPYLPDFSAEKTVNFYSLDPYEQSSQGIVITNDEPVYFVFPSSNAIIDSVIRRTDNGGIVTLIRDDVLRYQPPSDYEGGDTFQFSIRFGNTDDESERNISLSITNSEPNKTAQINTNNRTEIDNVPSTPPQ